MCKFMMGDYLLKTNDSQNKPFSRQKYPYRKTFDFNCSQRLKKYSWRTVSITSFYKRCYSLIFIALFQSSFGLFVKNALSIESIGLLWNKKDELD
jgi:hypothetical protein